MFVKVIKRLHKEEFLVFMEEDPYRAFINSYDGGQLKDKNDEFRDADHSEVWAVSDFISNFRIPTGGETIATQDGLVTVQDFKSYISVRMTYPTLIELLTDPK